MSYADRMDSTCVVWTIAEGATSLSPKTATVDDDPQPCYLAPAAMDRADIGGGQRNVGTRWLFMLIGARIAAERIVQIVTGPDAGTLWRCIEPPQRPRSHHTEIHVEPWHGVLT